jgi:hypothetical protein
LMNRSKLGRVAPSYGLGEHKQVEFQYT